MDWMQALQNAIASTAYDAVTAPYNAGQAVSSAYQNWRDGQPIYRAPLDSNAAAQQSTMEFIQQNYPQAAPGVQTPALTTPGWFQSTPNQVVIDQALAAIVAANQAKAHTQGAVAKRGGAANAEGSYGQAPATPADLMAAALAQRSSAGTPVYAAVGNDISWLDRNAAGTSSSPSYGKMTPANMQPEMSNEQAMARSEQLANLIDRRLLGSSVPPVQRPTMSEAAWLQAKQQQALEQQMQALMPMLQMANKMQNQGVALPAEWQSIVGNLGQQQNVMNWRAQQKALGNRT